MAKSIKQWQKDAFANEQAHGFTESKLEPFKKLALIHSEVTEALEEIREKDFEPTKIRYRDDGKPEGLPTELADIVIRVMGFAESYGIDLESAIEIKHAFNVTRPHMHGKTA